MAGTIIERGNWCLMLAAAAGMIAARANAHSDHGPFTIVGPRWFAEHQADANLLVLDVRDASYSYLEGHLPGAVHLAESSLRGPVSGLPVQYMPHEDLERLFERSGVTNEKRVLLYSDGKSVLGATMAAYCLLKMGHEHVSVLHEGFSGAADGDIAPTQTYPKYPAGAFEPAPRSDMCATLDDVKSGLGDSNVLFVDARPPNVFRGETKTWIRNGHIPGAVNVDWTTLMRSDNVHAFKRPEEIKAIFDGAGVSPDRDVIVYCGTGREASLLYLYLKYQLNYPRVRLYEGSWTEYSTTDLPVETGEGR